MLRHGGGEKAGKQKKLFTSTRARYYVAGRPINICGWNNFKYLGHKVSAMGVSPADIASLLAMLGKDKKNTSKTIAETCPDQTSDPPVHFFTPMVGEYRKNIETSRWVDSKDCQRRSTPK